VILAIVAVGLAATRVEMGRLTALTPAERAAIEVVRQTRLSTGATNSAVLHYVATHDLLLGGEIVRNASRGTPMWYAFSRPWERTVYVSWYLPSVGLFSWTVKDGVVKPDGETRLQLAKAAQVMAHPPAPNSVPAVPGIIPSIPPDLQ
jgi:hypothetical protein